MRVLRIASGIVAKYSHRNWLSLVSVGPTMCRFTLTSSAEEPSATGDSSLFAVRVSGMPGAEGVVLGKGPLLGVGIVFLCCAGFANRVPAIMVFPVTPEGRG